MRVLVACEVSGRVRDAFLARGHDAVSCDIEPSAADGPHICGRVEDVLDDDWDLVVAHPPCTYMSNANASCVVGKCPHPTHNEEWREWRQVETINAALLFHLCRAAGRASAVENPVPHTFARSLIGDPTSLTEPWWFGDPWMKRTGWWLRGLQPLTPTRPVTPTHRLVNSGRRRYYRHGVSLPGFEPAPPQRMNSLPGLEREGPARSVTPPGTAAAIATQWGHTNQTLLDCLV